MICVLLLQLLTIQGTFARLQEHYGSNMGATVQGRVAYHGWTSPGQGGGCQLSWIQEYDRVDVGGAQQQ